MHLLEYIVIPEYAIISHHKQYCVSHTHIEIFSTVILPNSLIQEVQLSNTGVRMGT